MRGPVGPCRRPPCLPIDAFQCTKVGPCNRAHFPLSTFDRNEDLRNIFLHSRPWRPFRADSFHMSEDTDLDSRSNVSESPGRAAMGSAKLNIDCFTQSGKWKVAPITQAQVGPCNRVHFPLFTLTKTKIFKTSSSILSHGCLFRQAPSTQTKKHT